MSQSRREFQVGDRVIYHSLFVHEYGVITKITIEVLKDEANSDEVRLYEIAMDTSGTFTGLSKYLRYAEDGQ